jgi:hypothetical protein
MVSFESPWNGIYLIVTTCIKYHQFFVVLTMSQTSIFDIFKLNSISFHKDILVDIVGGSFSLDKLITEKSNKRVIMSNVYEINVQH